MSQPTQPGADDRCKCGFRAPELGPHPDCPIHHPDRIKATLTVGEHVVSQPGQDVPDLCGDVAADGTTCTLPYGHDMHLSGEGDDQATWSSLIEIRKDERAKVAGELREQARIEAERLAPYRKGYDAIENAIVVWEFAANWIDPTVENHPPAKLTRGDAR